TSTSVSPCSATTGAIASSISPVLPVSSIPHHSPQTTKNKKRGPRPLFQEFSTCRERRQGEDAAVLQENDSARTADSGLLVARLLVGALDSGVVDEAGGWLCGAEWGPQS